MGTLDAGFTVDDREAEALRFYLLDAEANWADDVDLWERPAIEGEDPEFVASELACARKMLEETRAQIALLDTDPARFIEEEVHAFMDACDMLEAELWEYRTLADLDRFIDYLTLRRKLAVLRGSF